MYRIERFTTLAYNKPFLIKIDKKSGRMVSRQGFTEYIFRCSYNGVIRDVLFSSKMYNRIKNESGSRIYLYCHSNDEIYDKAPRVDYFRSKIVYDFLSKNEFEDLLENDDNFRED